MGNQPARIAGRAVLSLAELEGRWSVHRDVDDRRAGVSGTFAGVSVWDATATGLIQTETGVLSYGSAPPMQATRTYLWRAQGPDIAVFFDDARPFHIVPPPGHEALHDCPPDTYRVRYFHDGPDAFTTLWHVTGPRKEALLTTRFTRTALCGE